MNLVKRTLFSPLPMLRSCKSSDYFIQKKHGALGMYGDLDGKTKANIMNKPTDEIFTLQSYSQVGFRISGKKFIFGPVIVFPHALFAWNVSGDWAITEDSLALFLNLYPPLELLVVGCTTPELKIQVMRKLCHIPAKYKINLEIRLTPEACATYNFLVLDGRYAAAALIPPDKIQVTDNDVVATKIDNEMESGPHSKEGKAWLH